MKVRSDKDSTGFKKISLIDKLSLGMSYNMAADSFKWSDLSVGLRLKLSKSYTLNLNVSSIPIRTMRMGIVSIFPVGKQARVLAV